MFRVTKIATLYVLVGCLIVWEKIIEISSLIMPNVRAGAESALFGILRVFLILLFNAIAFILLIMGLPYIFGWLFRVP